MKKFACQRSCSFEEGGGAKSLCMLHNRLLHLYSYEFIIYASSAGLSSSGLFSAGLSSVGWSSDLSSGLSSAGLSSSFFSGSSLFSFWASSLGLSSAFGQKDDKLSDEYVLSGCL